MFSLQVQCVAAKMDKFCWHEIHKAFSPRGTFTSVSGLPSRLPIGKQTYSSQIRFDTYHVLIRLILINTVFRLLFFTNSKINYHDRFKPSLIFASLEEFSHSTFSGGRSEDSYRVPIVIALLFFKNVTIKFYIIRKPSI